MGSVDQVYCGLLLLLFAVAGAATAPATAALLRRADAPIAVPPAAGLVALGLGVVCWRWQSGGWPGWWLPVPCLLTVLAVPLALADLRHLRLPDVLTLPAYPAFAAAFATAAATGGGPALAGRALAGVAVFGGAHALIHLCAPGSLGAGDVKLSGVLGAVLAAVGWPAVLLGAVAAALLSVALAMCRGSTRGQAPGVPHGPGLLAAAWLCAVLPSAGAEVVPG
ncbi:prepilin peptidase [Amycolatopsis sp. NPDC058986]|uniref:prepilin peptidase n=1 Tax=unclassified Amycolatopsis TaxID=2618356 RepID=UPI00366F36F5